MGLIVVAHGRARTLDCPTLILIVGDARGTAKSSTAILRLHRCVSCGCRLLLGRHPLVGGHPHSQLQTRSSNGAGFFVERRVTDCHRKPHQRPALAQPRTRLARKLKTIGSNSECIFLLRVLLLVSSYDRQSVLADRTKTTEPFLERTRGIAVQIAGRMLAISSKEEKSTVA